MTEAWFSREDRFVEMAMKHALAQHYRGFLDARDAYSAYDCTILVPQTIEIKHDKKACTTGNLYFETRNTRQNAPSGLTATHAQRWAQYVPAPHNTIVLYDPQVMLALLTAQVAARAPGFRQTQLYGGDQNSQGIVAPLAAIVRQPFVTTIPFALELPTVLPALQGAVGRCQTCRQMVAIEWLQMGVCVACRDAA